MVELDPTIYTIAWIAPLEIEAQAAIHMLDHKHEGRFPVSRGDDYVFQAGDICGHNIVIATLPAGQEYGSGSAGALASQIKKTFPNLWFGLLVGVAAGLPNLTRDPPCDIRLGDVLVGLSTAESPGLVAYDLGKELGDDSFQPLRRGNVLASTEPVVRSAIGSIKLRAPNDLQPIIPFYEAIKHKPHTTGTFVDPGQELDELYEYDSKGSHTQLVKRERRPADKRNRIWYGSIGSGEKLMKNAGVRNKLRDRYNLIGLEMEAAGTMNRIAVGVIRGVCDYGDEHKNKQWQPYAAAMAAAYAKAVLHEVPPRKLSFAPPQCISPQTREGLWMVPFERNIRFVGRQAEISELKANIFKPDRPKKMAITGLGGIGKTQVAIELACQIKEEYRDCSIFWIPSMTLNTIDQAYLTASEKLALPPIPGEDVKLRLKSHLSQEAAGRWLLVFDNADDMDLWIGEAENTGGLKRYIPQSEQGFVLFTTRTTQLAVRLVGPTVVAIPEMSQETATHLLRTSLINRDLLDDPGSVSTLLGQLAFLPLAIAQAAAYMSENGLTIADYLGLLDEQEDEVIELLSQQFEDDWRYSDIKNPVATTWIISFNQIRQRNELAADYLSFMALIYEKDIPLSLLPEVSSLKKRTDALGLLKAYSFIQEQKPRRAFNMHRLVHLATRNWLRVEGSFDCHLRRVCTRMNDIFPFDDPKNRPLWRSYLPHAQLLLRQEGPWDSMATQRHALLKKVGLCLQSDGRYNEAEPLFVQLLGAIRERLGVDNPEVLDCMMLVASTHRNKGRWKEAETLDLEVLDRTIEIFGTEHQRAASAMDNLAQTYGLLGRWNDAEKLTLQALSIREKLLGAEHPETLVILAHLAVIHWKQGRRTECEQLEERVLDGRRRRLGPEHPDTLAIMVEHASTHAHQGRLDEAAALQRHALSLQRRVLGEKHPETLTTMADLATTLRTQERWDEAKALDSQVLEARNTVLGLDHPDTLTAMSNLAYTYWGQGKWEKAETIESQILEMHERLLGANHPRTLTAMANLASTYTSLGKGKDAEKLQKRALEIQTRELGEEHPDVLVVTANLAVTYWHQQQWGKAEELETRVFRLRKRILGPEHPQTLLIMNNLARTYIAQEKFTLAEELFLQLRAIQERSLGPRHPSTLETVGRLIRICRSQGRHADVKKLEKYLLNSQVENQTAKALAGKSEDRIQL